MLESVLQTKIKKYLETKGWYVVKYIQTTKNGWPDLGAHKDGRLVYVEVKKPGETAEPLQVIRHTELREKGFTVFVIDNMDDTKKLFV